jgi:hypothetical protein
MVGRVEKAVGENQPREELGLPPWVDGVPPVSGALEERTAELQPKKRGKGGGKRKQPENPAAKEQGNPPAHRPDPMFGQMANEGRGLSHRENLLWAVEAAGEYLRTGAPPTSCPNSTAFFLFMQALEEPKDVFGKMTQIAIKADTERTEHRAACKRSTDEIAEMLQLLIDEPEKDDIASLEDLEEEYNDSLPM